MTATMRAIVIDPENHQLVDGHIPLPILHSDDVLVKVNAVALNPADTRLLDRAKSDPSIQVLGFDACGDVVAIGAAVQHVAIGDKVYYAGDVRRMGAFAEYQAVQSALVAKKPKSLTDSQSASLPLTSLTAWEILHERFGLSNKIHLTRAVQPEHLLILGGAGGVGSMLIQLGKQLGLQVTATASRPESAKWCKQLGADRVISHDAPFDEEVLYQYIAVLNRPHEHWGELAKICRPFAQIACIVPFDEAVDMNAFMQKSISIHWEYMFTKSLFADHTQTLQSDILAKIATLIDQKIITHTQTATLGHLSAKTITQGLSLLSTNQSIGKLVLTGFHQNG